MNIRVVVLLVLAGLASCAAQPSANTSQEIFDEQDASTLLVVARPLVFARERTDVAAHARDYATLVAVEADISGEYSQFLLLYRWSTVDRRMSPPPSADAGLLRIVADGRVIDFNPLEKPPVNFGQRRELHIPNHGDVLPRAYKADPATLRYVANSRDITVRMPQEQFEAPFTIWEDGRAALTQFLLRAESP